MDDAGHVCCLPCTTYSFRTCLSLRRPIGVIGPSYCCGRRKLKVSPHLRTLASVRLLSLLRKARFLYEVALASSLMTFLGLAAHREHTSTLVRHSYCTRIYGKGTMSMTQFHLKTPILIFIICSSMTPPHSSYVQRRSTHLELHCRQRAS